MVIKRWCVLLVATAAIASAGADTRLADALKNSDRETALSLLKQGIDVNAPQADGMTALHWAVTADDRAMVEFLLRAGANAKAANRYGITPVYLACLNGNAPITDMLLKAGADANGAVSEGETALMTAARSGNPQTVRLLLDHGADPNGAEPLDQQTALMWAAAENHPQVVEELIQHGANVAVRTSGGSRSRGRRRGAESAGGLTALHFASREGALAALKALVAGGAGINDRTADGSSALLIAILNGHFEIASYLLEHGADPNLADETYGRAALYAAVDMRRIGWSPHAAPKPDKMDVLELIKSLLARGADPNARLKAVPNPSGRGTWMDLTGATPFFRAAFCGDLAVMRLLLANGSNPSVGVRDKTTPLMALAGVGWVEGRDVPFPESEALEAMQLLWDVGGVDPNAANINGYTALHGAAAKGFNKTVLFLVSHGADPRVKDKEGRSPQRVARSYHVFGWDTFIHDDTAVLLGQLANGRPNAGDAK